MDRFLEAAVIGAGVMGSGIAAHLANTGLTVTLLDLDPGLAAAGVARQVKAGAFTDPAFTDRIRTGSSIKDLALLSGADWIIEAAAERLAVKQQILGAIDLARKPGSIISSNTSTIRLSDLTAGMANRFAADFLITHFFNPPRWMHLLEIVLGPDTRPDVAQRIVDFAERRLGKRVVICKDTPGFIANRVGNFWMAAAINEALALNLDVEEADAVIGKPFGTPDRGIFGLADLVGIDLLPPVWRSLQSALPADDFMQLYPPEHPLIVRLIAEGRTGRKTGAGFMRRNPNGNYDVLDLATGEYRPQRRVVSAALDAARGDLRTLMSHPSPAGQYVGRVMGRTLAYAASLVPEIADSPDLVDQAMRDGYGWKEGPFELIDRIGPRWLSRHLFLTGVPVPQFLNEATSDDRFYVVEAGERWCRIPGQDKRLIVQHAGRVSLNS